jgi:ABC-type glycerol-3-phosphate transport system substrate-binding protein
MLSYRYFPGKEGSSMHRRLQKRAGYRKVAGITLSTALGLAVVAACSSSSSPSASSTAAAGAGGGPVTISVDCAPPPTEPVQSKEWAADVATFEKQNPNITVHSIDAYPCQPPGLAQFTAELDAGTEANVFYTYFGELDQVLDAGQAADITAYVSPKTVPLWNSIKPDMKAAVTAGKTLYGLPYVDYTQGLVYNRQLFQEAGLNPNDPPTTWAQVEADATAITKLGHGIYGYGDYSAGNNGGWHFSSEIDAEGGSMTNAAGTEATFDSPQGKAVLEALHTLRFTDKAMSPDQGLAWGTLQKQFADGKLGMYIAAPDDIYGTIVPEDKGNVNIIGMGPLPSDSGHPAGSLSGGDAYMFAKRDTPAQIAAGVKFINFMYLTIGQGATFNYARTKANGQPVGFPEPEIFIAGTAANTEYQKSLQASATINTSYYSAFVNANEAGDGQPVDDQAIYKTLDPVMLAVLTEPNANISQLLATASANVNTILANSG